MAHRQGRVHRDIKPSNVLLAPPSRRAKLTDFGIAMIDRPDAIELTRQGEMLGTPRYMAPEQIRGEHTTPRTDLWALGVTFYEMLAGTQAFPGDTLMAVTTRIMTDRPRSIEDVASDVPRASPASSTGCSRRIRHNGWARRRN